MKIILNIIVALLLASFACAAQSILDLGTIRVAKPGPVLRATIPLPPAGVAGGYEFDSGFCPVEVESAGSWIPAQWEPVIRDGAGRVTVVEVIAIVQPQPLHRARLRSPATRDGNPRPIGVARALAEVPPDVLVDGQSAQLAYKAKRSRSGISAVTREFYGEHFYGWVTSFTGQAYSVVEMVVHDGKPGSNVWEFGTVELGGTHPMVHGMPEPTLGPRQLLQCGWMKQRQRRELRFAIAQDAAAAQAATAHMEGAGWGLSDQWWQRSAWGPQALRLPTLSHLPNAVGRCASDWTKLRDAVVNGTAHGIGASWGAPNWGVGDYSPSGSSYGGVTGGGGIDHYRGIELLASGDPRGLQFYRLEHRTITDRHPIGLYSQWGNPIDPKQYGWKPSAVSGSGWVAKTTNPFPAASRSTPIDPWMAIDFQHLARRVSGSVVLTWLDNDFVAKRELQLNAVLWLRAVDGATAALLSSASANPGQGAKQGRADGWGAYTVAAAWACAAPHERDPDAAAWAASWATAMARLQMPNGIWQALGTESKLVRDPPYSSQHSAAQAIEHGILANGLYSVHRAFGIPGAAEPLLRAARDGAWRYAYSGAPGNGFTVANFAVKPLPSGAPYAAIPAGKSSTSADGWQIGSLLAHAALLNPGNVELAQAMRAYCGGPANDPLAWLRARGWENATNRLPMLTAAQGLEY